jgi:hypothetical protein
MSFHPRASPDGGATGFSREASSIDGQSLSAMRPSALQDQPSTFGGHSLTEAVRSPGANPAWFVRKAHFPDPFVAFDP